MARTHTVVVTPPTMTIVMATVILLVQIASVHNYSTDDIVTTTDNSGYSVNTTHVADNYSTDDTVTTANSTASTVNDTGTAETDTTAAANSTQTQQATDTTTTTTTTVTTTPTTPTTTAIPFEQRCTPGGVEKCASNLTCDSTINKCVCPSDQYYNNVTKNCFQRKLLGQACSADLECAATLNCTSDKCDCLDDLYYNSTNGSCVQKKNRGDNCGASSECKSNLTCVSPSNTCNCRDGFYYSTSGVCVPKLDHGAVCQISQSSDECKVLNTVCTSYPPSSTNKCLCASGFYWSDSSSSCLLQSTLTIAVRATTIETRRIIFSWTDVSQRSDVNYTISWGGSNTMVATTSGVTVAGLEPGTSYSFTVVTSLPADGNYRLIQVNQTPVTAWTHPDTPSQVTGSRRVDNITYEVTFGPSNGNVSQYTMTVRSGSVEETQSSTSTSIRFTKIQPATTYSYSLWSSNGNSDRSVPVTGSFTTDPEASGQVNGLNIIGVQSHTAKVTWKTPLNPNGNISGYLVEVTLQDSAECLYFKIPCHSCALLPTNLSNPNCTLVEGNASGNDDAYNLELLNLKPYRYYTVKVRAVNVKGLGNQTSLTFQTNTSVPHDISNLTVNSTRNEATKKVDLHITWTPGEQTGPTVYYILVQEALGLDTGDYNQSVSPLTVTGYNNTSTVKDNVLAYWNYNVSVWAKTDQGNSSLTFELYRTVENDPGPVENLNVTQDPTIANIVTLTFKCPEVRSRNGRIEKFVITQTLLNPQAQEPKENKYNHSATDGQPTPCSRGYTVTARNIIVERSYSFTVMTVNNKYEGGLSTVTNFEVAPQVPRPEKLKELLQVDSLVKQQDTSTEQTKITTVVCSSCLTDTRWGSVRNVGLLVCVKGSPNCTQPGRKKRSTAVQFDQFQSWATAKQQGFKTAYRTTPDKWIPPTSGSEQFHKFVVGENTSCRAADLTDYCNGPLPTGQEFYIYVIMCTTAGCTVYPETSIFKTSAPDDEPSPVGAIVGGVLGGLALVAVIGVIIFLFRHYPPKGKRNQQRPPVEHKAEIKEIVKKRPVRMRDFNDHVTKFHKDSNLLFQDEFENIRNVSETFNNTCDEAKREQNRVKNRWADILPYDHSRVKLNILSDDDETNDFINANYIPGYSSVREYIATQGPLYSTIPDFWKMIWEQKCKVIVMLSDLTEAGKRKVDLYWPENLNEPINYGTVVVEMTNFSQLNRYIIRNFRLIKGEETRKVTHFFLPGWPDYSADIKFDDVLGFVKAVRQEVTPDHHGPIVVHCSAGVGRSGTFIALDYFSQYVEQHSLDDSIDIFDFVLQMRKNRTRMVQVETQYIFIYDGINKLIQSKIKSEEEKLYENVSPGNGVYENFKHQEENIYANTAVKDDDKYVYNNEAFEPDFSHSQKSDKPTTEL